MTRGECLDWLYRLRGEIYVYIQPKEWLIPMNNALDIAIKALEQEPCEDAISRTEVLKAVEFENKWLFGTERHYSDIVVAFCGLKDRINKLPPVSVAEKTGRWITQWNPAHQKEYYYCSECREEYSYDGETGIKMDNYKYCPNCGARMAESEE